MKVYPKIIPLAAKKQATKYVSSSSAHVQPDKKVEQDDAMDPHEYTSETVSEIGMLILIEVYCIVINYIKVWYLLPNLSIDFSAVVVFLFLAGLWFTEAIINGPNFHPK